MGYAVLADLVVALHTLVVAYVVVGQLVIMAAAPFCWERARNPWFRFTHLGIIAFVVFEQFNDIRCFLSVWEEKLKLLAGMPFDASATFLGRFMRDILYIDVPQNESVFTILYVAMFVVVLQGLVMFPPRLRRPSGASAVATPAPLPALQGA